VSRTEEELRVLGAGKVEEEPQVRVASAVPLSMRLELYRKLVRDQTTVTRVINVCLQAYIDGAIPEEYMEQIRGWRKVLAAKVVAARQRRS
jgi:hypothetical protein